MKDHINDILVIAEKNRGGVPVLGKVFPHTTLNNYFAAFANRGGISLIRNSIDNTNARFAAERSLIGSMALAILIALTHFYIVEVDDIEWRATLKKLSDDERLLFNMVSDFHGDRPVRCRLYRQRHHR